MTQKTLITPEYPNGISVEYTATEIAQQQIDAQKEAIRIQAEEQAKAQKEADALAGNNKLLELGLTQAQVTAMTGYTPPTEV
jgi:hypothetical protein